MLTLAETTTDAAAEGFSLVPWIPLLVAFVVAASTIGTAWWNTRGESAALRQLKAMNEALDGIPAGRSVRVALEDARDRLAQRIADGDTKPSKWKRFGAPVLLTLVVLAAATFGIIMTAAQQPGQRPPDEFLAVVSTVAAGTAVGFAVNSLVDSRASRRRRQR